MASTASMGGATGYEYSTYGGTIQYSTGIYLSKIQTMPALPAYLPTYGG